MSTDIFVYNVTLILQSSDQQNDKLMNKYKYNNSNNEIIQVASLMMLKMVH